VRVEDGGMRRDPERPKEEEKKERGKLPLFSSTTSFVSPLLHTLGKCIRNKSGTGRKAEGNDLRVRWGGKARVPSRSWQLGKNFFCKVVFKMDVKES